MNFMTERTGQSHISLSKLVQIAYKKTKTFSSLYAASKNPYYPGRPIPCPL